VNKKETHALFKWAKIESNVALRSPYMYLFSAEPEGEAWKKDDKEAGKNEYLQFVCFCSTPQAVSEAVRKEPNARYVLMSGQMNPLQIAIPVFIRGKNLATMDHEWGEEEP